MRFHTKLTGDRDPTLPLLMGHFVPWYTVKGTDFPLPGPLTRGIGAQPVIEDLRHWHDARSGYRRTHLHLPVAGQYDSRDPEVMDWQFRAAREFGLSGFIVNWYGKNSVENVITLHWLEGLRAWNRDHPGEPLCYFISVDSQAQRPTEGKTPVSMEEDFLYIRERLAGDACLRRDGRPVFSVFPYENNCAEWRRALDNVFGSNGADLIWMNHLPGAGENAAYPWIRPDEASLSDGGRYRWSDPDNPGTEWLRSFYEKAGLSGAEYLMGGVWPGFDDQLVSWAWNPKGDAADLRPRVMCRESSRGNTLALTWQVYLDYLRAWSKGDPAARVPAPLVQIVTWNDYAEASTVEPTRDYGTAPLERCRSWIEKAREVWSGV